MTLTRSRRTPPWVWVPVILAISGAAVSAGIVLTGSSGTPAAGTALDGRGVIYGGLITIRTGTEIGENFVWLANTSHTPITIKAIKLSGPGVGTIIRSVLTEIAVSGRHSVPATAYLESPPVFKGTLGCTVQQLRPVAGYRLQPHKFVTLWTVLLAMRPGRYRVARHLITYTQAGTTYRQSLTQGYHGAVSHDAALLDASGDPTGRCWHLSHLLKGILPR